MIDTLFWLSTNTDKTVVVCNGDQREYSYAISFGASHLFTTMDCVHTYQIHPCLNPTYLYLKSREYVLSCEECQ